jgi:nucleoside-diphosphate-sugar epimerase
MPQSILVTGGAGFIGSHLAERLLAQDKEVFVVDDLSTGTLDNLAHVRDNPSLHINVDTILNHPMMDDTVSQVDYVVHLAAAVGVRKIIDSPVETITTNVRGTEIILDVCHKHMVPLYVASTSEIYGKAGSQLDEEHDRILGSTSHRRWSYACTKALDEFLALAFCHEYGLPVTIGRFFNTVGPRQTGQWGMVVPNFVKQALDGVPITVYGTGDQRRSFCHVYDSVRAVMGLIGNEDAIGEAYNIGNEFELTIMELAERVKAATGSSSEIVVVSYEEAYGEGFEDMERRQPNTDKLRNLLGWETEYDVDGILADVIDFYRGRMDA